MNSEIGSLVGFMEMGKLFLRAENQTYVPRGAI